MKRENRYIVLKRKDLDEVLDPGDRATLNSICETVNEHRTRRGAAPLRCVVIESDWQEYERAWQMIEQRVEVTEGNIR